MVPWLCRVGHKMALRVGKIRQEKGSATVGAREGAAL